MSTAEEEMRMSRAAVGRAARNRRYLLIGAIALGFAVLLVGGTALVAAVWNRSSKIAAGVSVAGLPVGGLTRAEARQELASAVGARLDRTIRLTHGLEAWTYQLRDLGAQAAIDAAVDSAYAQGRRSGVVGGLVKRYRLWHRGTNLAVFLAFDAERLRSSLATLATDIDRPAQDARIELRDGEITRIPHRMGLKLDLDETISNILARPRPLETTQIEFAVKEASPEITTEDIAPIDTLLATFTTRYNAGQANRSHNLALAASALDGSLIRPGEVFSYNEAVGKRSSQRGYKTAPIYAEGEVREGVGGGVCQPSSTLYNVALLANCDIVERHNHMMPVTYLPTGRDATVDYDSGLDLKFKNALAHPIWLSARAEGGSLTISAFGNSADKYDVEIVRTDMAVIPHETVEKVDETKEPGYREVDKKGRDGHRVTVTRVVRQHGEEVRREVLSRDYYAPKDTIVIVGPQEEEKPEGATSSEGEPEERMFEEKPSTPSRPAHPRKATSPAKPSSHTH